jgi:hypothetical protein
MNGSVSSSSIGVPDRGGAGVSVVSGSESKGAGSKLGSSSSRSLLGERGLATGGLVTSGTGSGRNREGSSDEADVRCTDWTGFGAAAVLGAFAAVDPFEAASDAKVVGGASATSVGVGCKPAVVAGAASAAAKELPGLAATGAADAGLIVDAAVDEAALPSDFPPFGKNIIVFLSDDLLSLVEVTAADAADLVAVISLGNGITGASSSAAGSSITGTESPIALVDSSADAPSGRKLADFTEVFAAPPGEAEVTAASKSAEASSLADGNSVESLSSGSVNETAKGLVLSVRSSL